MQFVCHIKLTELMSSEEVPMITVQPNVCRWEVRTLSSSGLFNIWYGWTRFARARPCDLSDSIIQHISSIHPFTCSVASNVELEDKCWNKHRSHCQTLFFSYWTWHVHVCVMLIGTAKHHKQNALYFWPNMQCHQRQIACEVYKYEFSWQWTLNTFCNVMPCT